MSLDTRGRRVATFTLAVLTAINFLNYIDRYVLASVLEGVRVDFGIADAQSGFLGSMFILVYMVISPFAGYAGDRVTRKYLVGAGVALWSLATVGSGFADSYEEMLAMRALVGVGEAGYATVAPAMIADLYARERRGRMLAYFYLATPVGSALGFVLGGAIAQNAATILPMFGQAPDAMAGWRLSFFVAGGPGILFAVVALLMPEPVRGGAEGQSDRAPVRGALRRLLRTPAWRIDTVGTTLMTFTLGGLAFWMPSFLQRVHGMEEGEAGIVFGGVTVVAGLVGTLVGGHLGDRAQARDEGGYFSVSGWGLLLGAPFVLACAVLGWLPLVFVAAFVAEFFLFLNTGPLNAALVSCVPATLRATAVALNVFMIHALGDAISPPLMGFISDVVGPMVSEGEGAEVVGLRLAIAVTAIPVAVGGLYLIRGARRIAAQPGGLAAHDDA